MTCHYPDCPSEVAAAGMSRCDAHRLRWALAQPVERPDLAARDPEWLRRAKTQKYGLARPLDRSAA